MANSAVEAQQPATPKVSLRPISDTDLPLLQFIYASTRERELQQVPWSDEQKNAFVLMQFNAQHRHYQTHFSDGRFDLILLGDEPVGRLYVGRWPFEISVIDISLLPEWRGRGIGGRLLAELIHEADALGKRVSVHVEKFNPARHLYERLGFIKVEDLEVYDHMIRLPAARAGT